MHLAVRLVCYPGLGRNFEFDVNIIFSATIRVTLYRVSNDRCQK